jgi:hypothetical protein
MDVVRLLYVSPELLTQIRDVYEYVGRYAKPTREEFELAFMRDLNVAHVLLHLQFSIGAGVGAREAGVAYNGGDLFLAVVA